MQQSQSKGKIATMETALKMMVVLLNASLTQVGYAQTELQQHLTLAKRFAEMAMIIKHILAMMVTT